MKNAIMPKLGDAHYLGWVVLLPFGVDVLFYLQTMLLGSQNKFWLAAFVAPILILMAISIFKNSELSIKFDLVSLIFILMSFYLFLSIFIFIKNIGYYTYIYVFVLLSLFIWSPTQRNVEAAIGVFLVTLFVLVCLSLILVPFFPELENFGYPIRHGWAHILASNMMRVSGVFRGVGVFGLFCGILVCYAIASRSRMSIPYAIIGMIGLFLSDSRAAFLAVLICSVVFLVRVFAQDGRTCLNRLNFKIGLAVSVISGLYFLTLGVSGFMSGSTRRIEIWQKSLQIGTIDRGATLAPDLSHAHNFVLQALIESSPLLAGILLVVVILLFIITMACIYRGDLFSLSLLIPILIFSSFEFGIHWSRLNLPTMGLVLGLLASRYRISSGMRSS